MAEKKWDVFIYGDINIDLVIPNVEKFPLPGQEDVVEIMNTYVGGGAALFTLGLGKLGMNPIFQASVGDDFYGEYILNELKKNNIDCSLIKKSKKNKTGISISFTQKSDRSFLTYRGTFDEIDMELLDMDTAKQSKHIHVTGYSGSKNHDKYLSMLKKVKRIGGVTVSFDVGWDDTEEWSSRIYELFPFIDLLFMNETEAIHYSHKNTIEEAIEDFSHHCKFIVAKLGSRGAMVASDGQNYFAETFNVEVVDTTGAGDSFNSGFVYGFVNGKSIEECLNYGNGCGAMSVTALGGNTGFPTEEALKAFLKERL